MAEVTQVKPPQKSFWLRWSRSEIIYLVYYALGGYSIAYLAGVRSLGLPDGAYTMPFWERLTLSWGFWLGNFVIWHIRLGSPAIYAKLLGLLFFWMEWPIIGGSFLWDSIKTGRQIASKTPWKSLFVTIYIPSLCVAFFEHDRVYLFRLARLGLWLSIIAAAWACLHWSLWPMGFVEKFRKIADYLKRSASQSLNQAVGTGVAKITSSTTVTTENKTTTATTVIDVNNKKPNTQTEQIKQKLKGFTMFATWGLRFNSFLEKPQVTLSIFIGTLSFIVVTVIAAFAGLYRIEYILHPDKSVFVGNLFTGTTWDFIYISVLQFMGGNLHGIESNSRVLMVPMAFECACLYYYFVLAVLAFSTAGKPHAEAITKGTGQNFSELLKDFATGALASTANHAAPETKIIHSTTVTPPALEGPKPTQPEGNA